MADTDSYDVIIIGSGAGGGTMAYALAPTGARILLVERGDFVPQEDANWDPAAVWKDLRYRATERWIDTDGHEFRPYMHYGVGGNSKYWGSVLYRLRREDFLQMEHADGISPAWPIDYETLAPYYDAAEHLYSVHGQSGIDPTEPPRPPYPHAPVPHAPRIAELVDALRARGLHPAPLPLGLRDPGQPGGCMLCDTCNSFPCRVLAKSEADVCCVRPALTHPNVTLATRTLARRLHTNGSGGLVESVELEHDGAVRRVKAPVIVVSAGAVQSAALLLRSASERHPRGLANSSDMVGRRYMAHLATMLQGFDPRRVNDTVFQKTVAINDFYFGAPNAPYPLGHIQSQGRTHGVMAQTVVPSVPLWAYNAWVARGVDWLVMSEDLPRFDNRVTLEPGGQIRLTYRPNNLGPHRTLVRRWSQLLKDLGFWVVMKHGAAGRSGVLRRPAHLTQNTTHQCGTLVFGTDPKTSVLDPFCRSHDVENLFIVDASFFPSSAAVNPALTIIAQALRVAEHVVATDLRRA